MGHPIVDKIREAGVVGAGGAGLPTHVKADAHVETVLVNGASCEPLLSSDPYLMENEVDTLVRGLEAVMECTGAKKGIICLKGKHVRAMQSVRAAAERSGGKIEARELMDFYPAGDEQVLVHEVLGRTVPERGLPLQVGAVVSNVETLCNVAHALDGKPVTHRYLTVAGEVGRPMVVKAPVGTPVPEVLAFAGGAAISEYRVVDGGPMMGKVLPDASRAVVTKTTSGLLVLPPDHNVVLRKVMDPATVRRITNTICCQCSRCTDLCPRHLLGHSLHPHKIMRVFAHQELESEIAREALLCSECGICEKYACPMLVSPREVNAQIKQILMKNGVKWPSSGQETESNPFREERRVPTSRLIQRLNLEQYDTHPGYAGEIKPSLVRIPLRMHLGAPAVCVVSEGQHVSCGDLIGEIPEKAMSARIHASIDGVVESVADGVVTIRG
ncbi:4Fe-4S dicluster domain-containing protein [uncultured Mailhella sp.]|uniref:4Fe-4S dicluster domain-containing protein n=1 Tax=uncultured Mailhella sp. TaxID=1981031 RepID=UPI00261FA020|nr:4Fe-4S dicluster domain-containing protein [uncultured Mailhella sp.]